MFILAWIWELIGNIHFVAGLAVGGIVMGFVFRNNVAKMTAWFAGLETRLFAKLDTLKAEIIAEVKKIFEKAPVVVPPAPAPDPTPAPVVPPTAS